MNAWSRHRWYAKPVTSALLGISCLALSAFAGGGGPVSGVGGPLAVPRAVCGPGDHPESALQGQVPAYLRAAGFQGFNCNLQLVGQSRGDGANWQTTEFRDGRHVCAYHGTSFSTANRSHLGVPVIDITEPDEPTPTGYLTTTSMLDPWESLKVNERRQLLAADNAHNGGGGPEVDIYDVSADCRFPQLLASVAVGTAGGGGDVAPVVGHEGAWAPDGLTYYGGDLRTNGGQYYAVDTTNPRTPRLITTWHPGVANVHGMSITDDGNRGYVVALGTSGGIAGLTSSHIPADNGLLIYDTSQIQARVPNPQVPLISK